jgi:hypothetical protein
MKQLGFPDCGRSRAGSRADSKSGWRKPPNLSAEVMTLTRFTES